MDCDRGCRFLTNCPPRFFVPLDSLSPSILSSYSVNQNCIALVSQNRGMSFDAKVKKNRDTIHIVRGLVPALSQTISLETYLRALLLVIRLDLVLLYSNTLVYRRYEFL